MKNNIFKNFRWEKDGNGEYIVTSLRTGKTITAIQRIDNRSLYCIHESNETQKNYYGQTIPKRYNKFEVMAFLENMEAEELQKEMEEFENKNTNEMQNKKDKIIKAIMWYLPTDVIQEAEYFYNRMLRKKETDFCLNILKEYENNAC